MANEADTCRAYVVPRLIAAGWDDAPHSFTEQQTFTDGRIVVTGGKPRRQPRKRADYLLRHTRDFTIAVVEAKAEHKLPADGLQQAKDYAEILGLKFAYATNGKGIVEYDYLTGQEREIGAFPTPADLWSRLRQHARLDDRAAEQLLAPYNHLTGKSPRYYQEIAINRTVQAILQGKRRLLLTMATGAGKTVVAFQICWKLWNARWNREGAYRRPRILYLADRNVLVDDPKDKTFPPFGDARWKIENGDPRTSREMYFATYQSLARDERRPGLYRAYPRDFFDLVIVDECHRGSASEESAWREILEWFHAAYQLGMTATPKRQENADSYEYFGDPLYVYSLRQGIEDGFLAPYRVHRMVSAWDATGWLPSQDDLDRYGRTIPDDEYQTRDFERAVALRARTEAIARHLAAFMRETGRFAKTIVFCVDQEHADEMRRALGNLNSDLMQRHPDYVCRVTADEGDIGRGHLSNFQEPERATPVILTTSQLLTTGVDAPTCTNVVIARVINSMTEFKQIIGRGTRVREDHGKLSFNILDYTGSATRLFADPDFDGDPVSVEEQPLDATQPALDPFHPRERPPGYDDGAADQDDPADGASHEPRKFYFDGGQVEIVHHLVHDLDPDGKQLRVISFTDYTTEKVRTLYTSPVELRQRWADPVTRAAIIQQLEERGIDIETLASATGQPEADPLDLLCHVAFNAPLRTRRERAERVRRERQDFFDRHGPEARAILNDLLEKYAIYGTAQFVIPDALKVPPISERGNIGEIIQIFGGPDELRAAINQLQALVYAA